MSHVIDTSVVLKWVVAEAGSEEAGAWAGTPLLAPDWIRAELGNALWKKVMRREIGTEQALRALDACLPPLSLVPAMPLVPAALALAVELAHPMYDCLFLALAVERDLRLLTADTRLSRACAGTRYADMVLPLGSDRHG